MMHISMMKMCEKHMNRLLRLPYKTKTDKAMINVYSLAMHAETPYQLTKGVESNKYVKELCKKIAMENLEILRNEDLSTIKFKDATFKFMIFGLAAGLSNDFLLSTTANLHELH